jgi:spermidine/putrescine transport system permease protein
MKDPATSTGGRLLLGLFFGLLVIFLYAPIAVLVIFSLNEGRVVAFPLEGFTLRWYEEFLSNPALLNALRRSAIVAAVSSSLAVAVGFVTSVVLVRRRFVGKAVVSAFVLSPLVIPYLVFGVSLLLLVRAVDLFLASSLGLTIGLGMHVVIVGHVVISLPYTILTVMPRLQRISVGFEEAARDLGASGLQTLRKVTLPLAYPAVVSAFLIAFTLSFDEYALASFVAGPDATYPIYLLSQLRFPALFPQMLAVASVVLAGSLLVVAAAEVGRRMSERRLSSQLAPALPIMGSRDESRG